MIIPPTKVTFELYMYNLDKDKDNYFQLGKILKTYGYQGELVILLDTDQPEAYAGLGMLFLNMEHTLVPWFINTVSIKGELATVKLDDIDHEDAARAMVGKEVYLPVTQLRTLPEEQFYFHEIIGYRVEDENHGDIGVLSQVLERPEQELLSIMKGEREIMVPLSDEMIAGIDRKKKILYLKTPPGLIDLYI